jgi:DNA-binding SARP family transcriptional activator/tetratricopeptide (TPR) repeat protein
VEFQLLGDLQVRVGGEPVELGTMKQRLVLAVLLVDAGRTVSAEALIDRVWDEELPGEARSALYTYIARIRRTPVEVLRRPGGYVLQTDPLSVDLHRLRHLAEQARGVDDPAERAAMLSRAVGLWHGEPLAGLTGDWAARLREGLRPQLLGVLTEWAEAELVCGRAGTVADRLAPYVERYPLAELLVAAFIRALYHHGRRAEALDQYARTRQRIADELGLDPGPVLRELHQAVLQGTLSGRPATELEATPAQDEPTVGNQLPAELTDHTGCEDQVARSLALLGGEPTAAARPVLVVSGRGGVGKTSLSIRVAHALRPFYPDGQIFVSLEGSRGQLADVLSRVLHALRVPDVHLLRTVEDRLVRYRSALSGKRILVVLDSAAGAEEVRPLVPGDPGSALIVSSRLRLTTIPGAEHVEVPALTGAESLTLLRRIVGAGRVDAEAADAAALAGLCGGLPLALRIVGARLAARPHWGISRLLQRMSDERRRLDEMAIDGLAVRVSVAVSHDGLDPAARRLFRLLGELGPPEFGGWLPATLLDESPDAAEDLLEQLVDARLVDAVMDSASAGPRYRMNDLVRLYARERAAAEDSIADRTAAVERAAVTATELADLMSERLPIAVPRLYRPASNTKLGRRIPRTITDDPGWLAAESTCLVGIVERAAELGLAHAACALADALVFASFAITNNFAGWDRAHRAALRAAEAAADPDAKAVLECGLALLAYKRDRFGEAERQFAAAAELFTEAGNELGAATARNGLGTVLREVGRHREAVPLLKQALTTLLELDDRNGAGHAAYCLGHCYRELGQDNRAVALLEQALELYRSFGHWRGEVVAIRGIGLVHRARGDLDEALRWSVRAHDMVRRGGDPLLACYTAQSLAKVWIRSGEPERAREPLEEALRFCRKLQDRFGVALIRRTVGEMHLVAGRYGTALFELQSAREVWRELDHDLGEARTLRDIGSAYEATGDRVAALEAWEAALAVFRRLGTREADEVAALLSGQPIQVP